ncbi:N-acetyltransferase GCN5 [Arthrobacter nitrophenolicus]|uniref:RimJ/RimL family protein N-acetyltransferase n=2 Tax=Arthrobacter nitrophenolicus TaxID=683150 RepID=A0ACC6TBE7_9MICC|nr:N-acetyltransferase GCN5 [Arthrobacter nitrophenolicus]
MTTLGSVWPLFDLRLTTPRLELRPIRDEDIPAAVDAARSGIHEPGKSPFSTPWTEVPGEELGTNMARWYWRCRAECSPESWTLLLGIWHEGKFIGCQDVGAKEFALLKTVSTGSWLKQSVQGRGLGKEMRAAVVLWAFDWLGAEVAESEAAAWNEASLGVSRSLGYELNGTTRKAWGPQIETVQHVRLTPNTFKRPDWQLQVEGHEAAAKFLKVTDHEAGYGPSRRSASPTRAMRRSPSDRSGAPGGSGVPRVPRRACEPWEGTSALSDGEGPWPAERNHGPPATSA